MHMTPNTSKQSGFTLLEIVVVIGVIAALLTSFLAFYQPNHIAMANDETKVKMSDVMDALSAFAHRNNRLPCPGAPDAAATSFGQENLGCAAGGGATWGIIPYRDLGLTQAQAQDGFGRYMTYIVSNIMVQNQGASAISGPSTGTPSNFCTTAVLPLLNIKRPRVIAFDPPPDENNTAAFVLIAYGSDGYGAYNIEHSNAASRRCAIGTAACSNNGILDSLLGGNDLNTGSGSQERENAVDRANNMNIYYGNYSTQVGAFHFDDQIAYATGFGLMSRSGAIGCSN